MARLKELVLLLVLLTGVSAWAQNILNNLRPVEFPSLERKLSLLNDGLSPILFGTTESPPQVNIHHWPSTTTRTTTTGRADPPSHGSRGKEGCWTWEHKGGMWRRVRCDEAAHHNHHHHGWRTTSTTRRPPPWPTHPPAGKSHHDCFDSEEYGKSGDKWHGSHGDVGVGHGGSRPGGHGGSGVASGSGGSGSAEGGSHGSGSRERGSGGSDSRGSGSWGRRSGGSRSRENRFGWQSYR